MKKLTVLALSLSVFLLVSMKQERKKIIFFGDSITQQGVRPNGYVDLIKKALEPNFDVIGAGIGGNKVYDLYLRLEDDVLNKKPSTVVIYVGVNDVWHKKTSGTGTDYDKFIKFYQALINKMKASNANVILCTPAVIGEKKGGANELDADLDKYSGAIRELAVKNSLKLCDLRKLFTEYGANNNPEDKAKDILTNDGVHLNDAGNKMVADNLLALLK